ncbi:hypothetical protein [Halomonas sp. NCCP-2165]|nr:hypothetical protein [Halomonas sp. NCCP-2165]
MGVSLKLDVFYFLTNRDIFFRFYFFIDTQYPAAMKQKKGCPA